MYVEFLISIKKPEGFRKGLHWNHIFEWNKYIIKFSMLIYEDGGPIPLIWLFLNFFCPCKLIFLEFKPFFFWLFIAVMYKCNWFLWKFCVLWFFCINLSQHLVWRGWGLGLSLEFSSYKTMSFTNRPKTTTIQSDGFKYFSLSHGFI